MKILILMRHSQAEPYAETDAQRALTPAGRDKAAATARTLQKAGYKPAVLLCSPLLRARQTAQTAGDILGLAPQAAEELDGRLSAKGLIDFAVQQLQKADCVMLVGHNPNCSIAAGILREEYAPFEAGTAAVFDMTDPQTPKFLPTENK